MFIVDITLKNTPMSLSVQRNDMDSAQATYQDLLNALQSGDRTVIELTCDRQTEKKVAILVEQISAVQMSEKSGSATSSGRPPGFFALAESDS